MITQRMDRASAAVESLQEVVERVKAGITITKRLACGAGGALLVATGLRRKGVSGTVLALAGGDLIYRGFRGEGHLYDALGRWRDGRPRGLPYGRGVKFKESVVVRKPAKDLYRIWRNFELLPAFMPHIDSVEAIDDERSHWVLKAPGGPPIEWDAEVIADREGEMIGWRSANGSIVAHAGSVRFEDLGGDHTRVVVALQYNPAGGEAGAAVARLLGSDPQRRIRDDLKRFREFSESVDLEVVSNLVRRARPLQ